MKHDEFSLVYEQVYGSEPDTTPGAWIQWKGTAPCIDLHCACGVHGHLDDTMFLYIVKCVACGALYALGQRVEMHPLTAQQAAALGNEPVEFSEPETE